MRHNSLQTALHALVHSPAKHLEPTALTSTSDIDESKSVAPVDTMSHPSNSAATQELSDIAEDEKISNEKSQHLQQFRAGVRIR